MTVPEEFAARLDARFNGRFRIRWSDVEGRYLIEQRIARAIAEGFMPRKEYRNVRQRRFAHEDHVRAQDGYMLTGIVTAGTKAYCTRCDAVYPSKPFVFTSTACQFCASKGIEQPVLGGFFHLNDQLIEELEKADPHKGGTDRISESVKLSNEFLELQREADFIRPIDAAARDRYRRLLGIPMTGATKVLTGSTGSGTQGIIVP